MPPEAKANPTDPDSRIMKTRRGYLQGYNAQVVVTEDQVIVAAEVTQECNEVHQLHPLIGEAESNLEQMGVEKPLGELVADAGYWSEANAKSASPEGPELFIATTSDRKQREAMRDVPPPRRRMPKNPGPKERMERKLRTRRGREAYAKRAKTVEPVFGQIKEGRACERFQRRGLEACRSEWKLICVTHNLLKLWRRVRMLWEGNRQGEVMGQAEPVTP